MVLLSVIIVNYNVEHFLKQCLESVQRATRNINAEIFVVDNNSIDGSCSMVKNDFTQVHLIENKENVGFSTANNQAISLAKGKYILLLNPDTLVEENCFELSIQQMDKDSNIGALGVKLIDGAGQYLAESKRGFPDPWSSFCKISGLYKFFPKSKLFNKYYLGHLGADQVNKIEVLCGAFMLLNKSVLDKIGLLDEQFFMYGEDIDLSYRIIESGHSILYYPNTSIIHYKGESTKKASFNYVKHFYNAMILFTRKHYKSKNKFVFFLLKLSIIIGGFFALIKQKSKQIIQPSIDFVIVSLIGIIIAFSWAYGYFADIEYYNHLAFYSSVFGLALVLISGLSVLKVYKEHSTKVNFYNGFFISSVLVVILYSLLPEEYRFSRLVLVSQLMMSFIVLYFRHIRRLKGRKNLNNVLFISNVKNSEEWNNSYADSDINEFHFLKVNSSIEELVQKIIETDKILNIKQLIFASSDISNEYILRIMSIFGSKFKYKIATSDFKLAIGSDSKDSSGQWMTLSVHFQISNPQQQILKRIFDFIGSCCVLLFIPLTILSKNRTKFLTNLWNVMIGQMTWVGYNGEVDSFKNLPVIKPSVFPYLNGKMTPLKSNELYAKEYHISKDVETFITQYITYR